MSADMRLSGLLSRAQVETVHRNALRVLEDVGVRVEHDELVRMFGPIGGLVDSGSDRVRFPRRVVEDVIAAAPKAPPREGAPEVSLACNVYQCLYLDPYDGELKPFDEDLLAGYFALADGLPLVDGKGLLGLPFVPDGVSARSLPLAEKLYAWKYGAWPGGSVHFTDLCEPLLEMFRVHASAVGRPVEDVFSACGFLISPLRLARPECEQLLFFAHRGLRMHIGHLASQGGSAPVTLGGSLVLALAEQLFLFLLRKAVWGDAEFRLGAYVSTMDMRTGASCFGRPELQRTNLAFADIAGFYGCRCSGHACCSDAHTPSYEAGVQKTQAALINCLADGRAFMEAGLLGVDEICSPIQMVLDHDMAANLRAMLADAAIDEAECAFEEIAEAGPGGMHLGTDFTVRRFRGSLFEPATWSNQSHGAWRASGSRTDVDKAREIVDGLRKQFTPCSHISDEEERELRAVIEAGIPQQAV